MEISGKKTFHIFKPNNNLLSCILFQNQVMYGLPGEMTGSPLLCQLAINTDDTV
jgi:hypothetical protein